MHEILFYEDRSGNIPVYDYMQELAKSGSKDSRIKLNKISQYTKFCSQRERQPENR